MHARLAGRADVILSDGKETDIVILVIGQTGSGMSTFINSVLPESATRMRVGSMASISPCTSAIAAAVIPLGPRYPALEGRRLILVDTPGTNYKEGDEVMMWERALRWLRKSYSGRINAFSGVICLHGLPSQSVKTTRTLLTTLKHYYKRNFQENVVLAITKCTHEADLEEIAIDDDRQQELLSVHLQTVVPTHVRRFMNDMESGRDILEMIPALRAVGAVTSAIARCGLQGGIVDIFSSRKRIDLGYEGLKIDKAFPSSTNVVLGAGDESSHSLDFEKSSQTEHSSADQLQADAILLTTDSEEFSHSAKESTEPISDPILEDGRETDIVIPIMGATGAGKSSFINCILGENRLQVGHGLRSETASLAPVVFDPIPNFQHLAGCRLVIVDTPGFNDTYLSDVVILKRIAAWLGASYKKKMVLGGVIYLHDISLDRFCGSARQNLEMFQELCGDAVLHKVVLATTKWGKLHAELQISTGEDREKELAEVHWKTMIDKGTKAGRYTGNSQSAWDILDAVIQSASDRRSQLATEIFLQIQEELIREGKILPETKAGAKLQYNLQELLEIYRDFDVDKTQRERVEAALQLLTGSGSTRCDSALASGHVRL